MMTCSSAVDGDIEVVVSANGGTIGTVTLTSGSAAGAVVSVDIGGVSVNIGQKLTITFTSANTNPGIAMISIEATMSS